MNKIKWDGKKDQGLSLQADPDDYVIVLNALGCRKCKTTAVSRHRHDYVSCKCGAVSVDGGLEYFRAAGDLNNAISLHITASPDVRDHIQMVIKESPVIQQEAEDRKVRLLKEISDMQK